VDRKAQRRAGVRSEDEIGIEVSKPGGDIYRGPVECAFDEGTASGGMETGQWMRIGRITAYSSPAHGPGDSRGLTTWGSDRGEGFEEGDQRRWGRAEEAADDVGGAGQTDPQISPNPGTDLLGIWGSARNELEEHVNKSQTREKGCIAACAGSYVYRVLRVYEGPTLPKQDFVLLVAYTSASTNKQENCKF